MNPATQSSNFDLADLSRIVSIPGVCGGDPCVTGTRIPVWGLAAARKCHRTVGQILEDYPSLTAPDVAAAWRYAELNEEEINRQILENEESE